jgi:hypothetical protein
VWKSPSPSPPARMRPRRLRRPTASLEVAADPLRIALRDPELARRTGAPGRADRRKTLLRAITALITRKWFLRRRAGPVLPECSTPLDLRGSTELVKGERHLCTLTPA